MDTFFQKLRDIQKKERNTGTLSEIDDSFYNDASNYLQELLKRVNNNPLSLEAYQLRDAQRITTEICERREFKIVSTAATNVQKAHDIFKGHKKDSELYDIIPYNTTPEEEEFYKKIVDMMIDHREHLMEKIIIYKSDKPKIGFKSVHKKEVKEVPSKDEKTQTKTDDIPTELDSTKNKIKETETNTKKTDLRPKTPILDESQIAMMFGQAPDDVLLDENNNPIKPVKRDITTPFKGPEPPKEDTVSLQNKPENEAYSEEDNEDNFEENKEIETVDTSSDKNMDLKESPVEENAFNDVELVSFKKEITTDILDENEKTYGPFVVGDIVLLPKSLVEILTLNDVINIIP